VKETTGNLWNLAADFQAVCITTNGYVRADGAAVMGRGCAKEAAGYWPELPFRLGLEISMNGNHLHSFRCGHSGVYSQASGILRSDDFVEVLAFPVKHAWFEKADISLILQSARELVAYADTTWLREVLLPCPGCGNGQLDWVDVAPELEAVLDDRFTVTTF
jgi:hypothetical protein